MSGLSKIINSKLNKQLTCDLIGADKKDDTINFVMNVICAKWHGTVLTISIEPLSMFGSSHLIYLITYTMYCVLNGDTLEGKKIPSPLTKQLLVITTLSIGILVFGY